MAGSSAGAQGHAVNSWSQLIQSLYPDILRSTICVPPVHFHRTAYDTETVGSETVLVGRQPASGGAQPFNPPALVSTPMPNPPSTSTGLAVMDLLKTLFSSMKTTPACSQTPGQYRGSQPSSHSLWTPQPLGFTACSVQDSDVRDDFAQHHVLTNLQELGTRRGETMFLLSQVNFSNYLNKGSSYSPAAARLPKPSDLDKKRGRGKKRTNHPPPVFYSQGDFDVMVIHRQHGILLGELKSVGRNQAALNLPLPQADAEVAKKVTRAVRQLDKSEVVVKHLVSDIAAGLTVKKTLMLPYVSSSQLKRVLAANPQLQQEVCQSLEVTTAADAVRMCLCSDQLSEPDTYWDVTPEGLSRLAAWWQDRMACTVDPCLSDQLYLDIVASLPTQALEAGVAMFLRHQMYGGMWVSSVQTSRIPRNIPVAQVTIPLRFAPVVQREVDRGLQNHPFQVLPYSERVVPAPGDGLGVVKLRHAGPAHQHADPPVQCQQCGQDVAQVLRRFHVGQSGHVALSANSPPVLEYRDVFILTRSCELREEVKDAASGRVVSPACGLVRGLRSEGVPVCVLERSPQDVLRWQQDVADTAVAGTDRVTVTHFRAVNGLERKLVVWLPGRGSEEDDTFSDDFNERDDRLFAMSRCTTQLVVIERPKIAEPDLD